MEALTPICCQCLDKCCLFLQEVTATSLPPPGEEETWNKFWVWLCNLFSGLLWDKVKQLCCLLGFCDKSTVTLEQVAWKGCGVSILGDIQNPAGHGQPALAKPALSRGVGLGDLQRSLPTSAVLWFYSPNWTWKKEKYITYPCFTILNAHMLPLLYFSGTNFIVWVE